MRSVVINKYYRTNQCFIKENSKPRNNVAFLFTSVCLLFGIAMQAHAVEPEEIVKYRQNIMVSQRAHMAAAAAIIEGKVEFNDQLNGHVRALEAMSKDIPNLFPNDSNVGETKALDAVWKNNAEFVKRAKTAQEKSRELVKTVEAGDTQNYGARLKDLLDACKSCHKDFRKKKEKK